jgi:hypothetical protein
MLSVLLPSCYSSAILLNSCQAEIVYKNSTRLFSNFFWRFCHTQKFVVYCQLTLWSEGISVWAHVWNFLPNQFLLQKWFLKSNTHLPHHASKIYKITAKKSHSSRPDFCNFFGFVLWYFNKFVFNMLPNNCCIVSLQIMKRHQCSPSHKCIPWEISMWQTTQTRVVSHCGLCHLHVWGKRRIMETQISHHAKI